MRVVTVPPPHDAKSYYADETKIPRCTLLDEPSAPHPWLDMLMHHALLRLYLLADGATASLEYRPEHKARGDAGPKAHPSMIPTSSAAWDIDKLWSGFSRATTHRVRLRLILEAQELGRRVAHAPDRSFRRDTIEWRERIANDPRSDRQVATVFGISHQTVGRIRKRYQSREDVAA
jgi:hypothetical protein